MFGSASATTAVRFSARVYLGGLGLCAAPARHLVRTASMAAAASAGATQPTHVKEGTGKPRVRGIVFDMDGTLTRHGAIDFARMKRRIGIRREEDTLTAIAAMDTAAQARALKIVEEEERAGLAKVSGRSACVSEWMLGSVCVCVCVRVRVCGRGSTVACATRQAQRPGSHHYCDLVPASCCPG